VTRRELGDTIPVQRFLLAAFLLYGRAIGIVSTDFFRRNAFVPGSEEITGLSTNVRLATVFLVVSGLQGCVLIAEGPVMAQLHNLKTHETAHCGEGMHKGLGWTRAVRQRDECISNFEAKGFVLDFADPSVAPALEKSDDANTPQSERALEATDVYIRRLAGLSASSARGEIAIVDVGHMPMDTMISIVASRAGGKWHVSYACALSPRCSADADHASKEYDLTAQSGQRVDAIIDRLRDGVEPGGTLPGTTTFACGRLTVAIDYQGFKQTYYRACDWGQVLGELEMHLQPPAAD
jgi:hypothetical protein